MAIGTITRLPDGAGAAQYDEVTAKMGFPNDLPEGLIFHSAGELDGRFQIFNVWESREHFDRFARERLGPARVAIMGEERAAEADADVAEIDIHRYLIP